MDNEGVGLTEQAKQMAFRQQKIQEARKYLDKDYPIRKSGEELENLIAKKGIDKRILTESLGRQLIYNWSNKDDKKRTDISRESAVKILLLLKVDDLTEAEDFIMHSCGHDGFYARDYKDIIYMFCLRSANTAKEIGIEKMDALIKEYKYLDSPNPDVQETDTDEKARGITKMLFDRFEETENSEEGLKKFFDENKDNFGSFKRTAHKIFMEYFDHYRSSREVTPDEDIPDEQTGIVSLQKIVDSINKVTLTSRNRRSGRERESKEDYIPDKTKVKRAALELVQKVIAQDALIDRPKLGDIVNKKENVPRKYLILFFLAYSGGDKHMTLIEKLDNILYISGMPRLDSRNPFDWIVMHSLYHSDIRDTGAIDRLKKVAKEIFKIDEE